jgi:hypothetical protein
MSKRKKEKFGQIWSNQTNLGKHFGLSAIAVGKVLIEHGLKDPETKLATEKALSEGFARSTPLKSGIPYFMWNIEKISSLLSKDHEKLSGVEYYATEVRKILCDAQSELEHGNDKIGYLMADTAFDNVPKNLRQEVENIVNGCK